MKQGGYWDFCDFPLQNAEPEIIANYPVTNPDDFDYDSIGGQIDVYKDFAIHIGSPGMGDIINSMGRIMGMENILCNLMIEDEATLTYLNRRMDEQLAVAERSLDKYKGRFDFMWLGEDLGTQDSPYMSCLRKNLKALERMHINFKKP